MEIRHFAPLLWSLKKTPHSAFLPLRNFAPSRRHGRHVILTRMLDRGDPNATPSSAATVFCCMIALVLQAFVAENIIALARRIYFRFRGIASLSL